MLHVVHIMHMDFFKPISNPIYTDFFIVSGKMMSLDLMSGKLVNYHLFLRSLFIWY